MAKIVNIDKQDFINSVNEGLTRKELAVKYNTNVSAINQAMRALGLNCKKGDIIKFTESVTNNQLDLVDEVNKIEEAEKKKRSLVDFSPYKDHMPIEGC